MSVNIPTGFILSLLFQVCRIVTAKVQNVDGARRLAVNHTLFWNVLISCPAPTMTDLITHVSITQNPHVIPNNYLNVIYPKHPSTYEHKYGMCQSNGVLYGKIEDDQASWFIEWFELNHILGISEFTLYNSTVQVTDSIKRVFNYYKQRGLLKLHHIPPPFLQYSNEDQNATQIPMKLALNDCLYRNMYRYKYAIVIDMDEIIVPQVHDNYDGLVEYLKPHLKRLFDNELPSLSFGSYAFYKTYPESAINIHTDLLTSRKTYYNHQAFKQKTFFNPRHCLSAFSHFCLKPLKEEISWRQRFRPEVSGAVHHYRAECESGTNQRLFNERSCQNWERQKQLNTRMYFFCDLLSKKIQSVKQNLGMRYFFRNPYSNYSNISVKIP